MPRVNPLLLDVAIFMTYPTIIGNVSYIFPSWAIWSVLSKNHQGNKICCVLIHRYLMLRVFHDVSTYE